jgi:hypothetical protein
LKTFEHHGQRALRAEKVNGLLNTVNS